MLKFADTIYNYIIGCSSYEEKLKKNIASECIAWKTKS